MNGNIKPIIPLKSNYASPQYIQAYTSLFSRTGSENKNEGNDVTHVDYPKGHVLHASYLSPDLTEEGHFNLAKQRTVRIELKFGAALPITVIVVVIVYNTSSDVQKHWAVLYIDKNRRQ